MRNLIQVSFGCHKNLFAQENKTILENTIPILTFPFIEIKSHPKRKKQEQNIENSVYFSNML